MTKSNDAKESSIDVIFENDDVVVINKPSGLITHTDGKTNEPSVSDWYLSKYPENGNVGEPIVLQDGTELTKPGIVHRLDRDTSGVMILPKNQETFLFLKEQFKERTAKKMYTAFVYGQVKDDEGTIDRPIGRSAKDFRLRSAQFGARGTLRKAVTEYRVTQRGEEATLLELFPKTGRTHQLRVHLKAINHPIVADSLYAPKQPLILGLERLALHATALEISISEGVSKVFEAPLPADFEKARALL